MAKRAKSFSAVLGAACALALGVSSTASAASYTWQNYTRDGSWNCGQAGSTKQVGNLYVLPCVKVVYGDWQPILIVTAASNGGYISNEQIGLYLLHGTSQPANDWDCADSSGNKYPYIPAHTSLACFSPTVYTPNNLVDGEFWVSVNGSDPQDLYSPWVQTSS